MMSCSNIQIELAAPEHVYQPGELLTFAFRLKPQIRPTTTIEVSVLWFTEGKGDEDLGVHFFERLSADEGGPVDLAGPHTYSIALPNSPLSYDGRIVKIRWCVRVRTFNGRQEQDVANVPFQLGLIPTPRDVVRP